MTLSEAIEEVKKLGQVGGWEAMEIYSGIRQPQSALAIATILNAVVKGELKG